jgi:[ribosomal protein S5]-alanine N-acetyltransferase
VLDTPRLQLRPPRVDDAEAIFRGYATDPEVTRYLTWTPHKSLADTRAFLRACMDAWRLQTEFPWAITPAADERSIGMIELRPTGHMAMVGYVLAREEWGKGYMTEALTAVVDTALALRGIYRVWAVCDVENGASARVMEKAGLVREGVLKRYILHPSIGSEPRDALCYAKTR